MTRLDRLATLYFSWPIANVIGPHQGTRLPILMYHSISGNLFGISHPFYHIHTLPTVFSEQMRWLRSQGYRTLDLPDAWAALNSGADLSKTVVLTFDDGYRDFYTEAMEVLTQCGFTATIFLATDRIRQTSARVEGADYLTWDEVRELHRHGIQFGSHTVTHADLRSLEPAELEFELGQSKEVIEQNLGAPIDSFSYPFSFPEEDKSMVRFVEDLLENFGFDYGVCRILGRASRKNNKLFMPRLPVNNWDDTRLLRAKLEGGYDWLHWPQLLKRSIWHNATSMQPNTRTRTVKPAL